MIAFGGDAQSVPLAKRGSLDACAGDLTAPAVVVVEIEIVLQSIGTDHVIATFGEAEDNAARRVPASRHRLETYRDVDVGVGAARRDDHVEGVARGALTQRAATL